MVIVLVFYPGSRKNGIYDTLVLSCRYLDNYVELPLHDCTPDIIPARWRVDYMYNKKYRTVHVDLQHVTVQCTVM